MLQSPSSQYPKAHGYEFEDLYPVVVTCRRWAKALGYPVHAFAVLACGYANYVDPKSRIWDHTT